MTYIRDSETMTDEEWGRKWDEMYNSVLERAVVPEDVVVNKSRFKIQRFEVTTPTGERYILVRNEDHEDGGTSWDVWAPVGGALNRVEGGFVTSQGAFEWIIGSW